MKKIIVIFLVFPILLIAADLPSVKQSYMSMPFSNGTGVGVYQAKKKGSKLLYFYDHLYKAYSAKNSTKTYVRKGMYWGINDKWLTKLNIKEAYYISGTGIVQVNKEYGDLEITEYYFMPYSSDKRIIVSILDIKNNGSRQKIHPYFYQDNALGGGASVKNEMSKKIDDIWIEYKQSKKSGKSMLTGFDSLVKGSFIPYKEMNKEIIKAPGAFRSKMVPKGNNLIAVYKLKETKLDKGQRHSYMAVIGLAETEDESDYISELQKILQNTAQDVLKKELTAWKTWQKKTIAPVGMRKDEKELFYQSAVILRMGQVLESGKAFGQILASIPPGMWNISWVRDGVYSLLGLIQTGHLKEAKWGLKFMLNAPNGKLESLKYVGKPYKISVCRYWGNGDEETDYNNHGPNVEWDNFGLFLWAFSEYVKVSGDKEFLKKYYPIAKELVADVLIHLMSEEGYLVRDSSIWERHWEPQSAPDGRKHFSYSTINAINGLQKLASIAPNEADQKELLSKAKIMQDGFKKHMISEQNVVVSTIEEKKRGIDYYMDGSTVEALNFDLVDKKTALATLKAFKKHLRMKKSPGFLRNDDAKDYKNSWYDEQEWVMIDLRIAHAYQKWGNSKRADELNLWVVENAKQNFYLISELLDQNNLKYQGAVPMMGFGSGAFILNMYQRYGK